MSDHDARTVRPGYAVTYHNEPRRPGPDIRRQFPLLDFAPDEPEPSPFEHVVRALREQAAALDVAWDRLHAAGWQPEQVEIRRHVEDPGLVQLAVRDGGPVLFEARIEIVLPDGGS